METIVKNSACAWLLAARPKTLSAALIPVAAPTALAFSQGKGSVIPALLCTVFALLMQVAANFINDWLDFARGTDSAARLGPKRACQQGWVSVEAMKVAAAIVIVAACAVGLCLVPYRGWPLVAIGVACVVFAFLYTSLLSYCGLGDLLVWLFFGLVPVAGTYWVMTGEVCSEVWLVAVGCGLATDNLLVVNNYRDRDTDRASGKRTLIVVLGERFGRWFYLLQGVAAVGVTFGLICFERPWAALLPLLYLPFHVRSWCTMRRLRSGAALNKVLGSTSMGILLYGLLLTVGLAIGIG